MRKCIEDVTALQLRLKKIVGQLTGVQKMLAEDVPCEDILTQLNAANGALHRLSFIVLDGHLRHCVALCARGDRERQRGRDDRIVCRGA